MKEIFGFCGAICATGILLSVLTLKSTEKKEAMKSAEKEAEMEFKKAAAEKASAEKAAAEKAASKKEAKIEKETVAAAKEAGFTVYEYKLLKTAFDAAVKKGDIKTAKEIAEKIYPFIFS